MTKEYCNVEMTEAEVEELFSTSKNAGRRTRGERRKNDFKKAVRKRSIDIAHEFGTADLEEFVDKDATPEERAKVYRKKWKEGVAVYVPYYDNIHQYSKNKIHCSCPLCSGKDWRGRHVMTNQERKTADKMTQELLDLANGPDEMDVLDELRWMDEEDEMRWLKTA